MPKFRRGIYTTQVCLVQILGPKREVTGE